MKIFITDMYVSEAAHLQGRLRDLTTPFYTPETDVESVLHLL